MSLSMIVYLADVLPMLSSVLGWASGIGFLILSSYLFFNIVEGGKIKWITSILIFLLLSILGLISILIPSKEAVYLMAGANVTQQLADTPEATKARKALNLGLDKIIMNLQESK